MSCTTSCSVQSLERSRDTIHVRSGQLDTNEIHFANLWIYNHRFTKWTNQRNTSIKNRVVSQKTWSWTQTGCMVHGMIHKIPRVRIHLISLHNSRGVELCVHWHSWALNGIINPLAHQWHTEQNTWISLLQLRSVFVIENIFYPRQNDWRNLIDYIYYGSIFILFYLRGNCNDLNQHQDD